jgi:hypothetical protein
MIDYLLTASLSLLLLFGFYKIVLENERLHRFKRYYLLGSLLFSAVVPVLSLPPVWPEAVPLTPLPPTPFVAQAVAPAGEPVGTPSGAGGVRLLTVGLWLYGLVTGVLLLRFVGNGYALIRRVARYPKQPFRGATLVLVDQSGSPYTFLNYLFVPEAAYRRGEIEAELFTHELAHIRQGHSFDVLLIELLRCFGWFNPVLGWVKRAIQLNHEFLADEAVTGYHQNVPAYQHLLLSRLTLAEPVRLTSTLTFQTTKQRFRMMTKHTSPARAFLAYASALLLVATLTGLFGTRTVAQTVPAPQEKRSATPKPRSQTDVAEMERLYGDKWVDTWPDGRNLVRKKYSDLTPEDKKFVHLIPPFTRRTPTESQFESWKNSGKYGIWVDGKRTRDFASTSLKADDIASYWWSYVYKNARQPEGYLWQVELMTADYYENYLKENAENPLLILRKDLPKGK